MAITLNRLVELAITTDPTAALAGQTLSVTNGGLITEVNAALDAGVTGTLTIMQPGDTIDLNGDGTYEGIYQGRFNFTSSTFTMRGGATTVDTANIIEVTVGGISRYYLLVNDSLAPTLEANDLSAITFGPTLGTNPNTAGLNFDDATTYQLVCFADGTLIATDKGERLIEKLKIGDHVLTKDNGMQSIRWIGSRVVRAVGKFAPIVFQPGAVGNRKTMRLSPQHRIEISDPKVELLFGHPSALASAHVLVNGRNITIEEGGVVEYFHILFDQHELIKSDGVWTESFFPTQRTLSQQDLQVQTEIYSLFPELASNPMSYGSTVRMCLKPFEVKTLQHILAQNADNWGAPISEALALA